MLTPCRVLDEISLRENFAKLATKRFSCFAKMRDEFREFRETAEITVSAQKIAPAIEIAPLFN
jgi:hypothetical protein